MFTALRASVNQVRDRVRARDAETDPVKLMQRKKDAQDALFDLEALVIAFCAFGDCFESSTQNPGGTFFTSFPPSNLPQLSFGGMMTGVLDTPENPCCCKLLVDIENIAKDYKIVTTS